MIESRMICAATRGSSVDMSRPSIRRQRSCSSLEKQASHVRTSSVPSTDSLSSREGMVARNEGVAGSGGRTTAEEDIW